jgi:hypothetical protein
MSLHWCTARLPFVCLGAFALAGCAGPLAAGEAAFDKGHYPEAKQLFAAIEGQAASWPEAERAEYALYRGLTFTALGDRARSTVWLDEAKALEDARAGTLSYEDARRLAAAIDARNP